MKAWILNQNRMKEVDLIDFEKEMVTIDNNCYKFSDVHLMNSLNIFDKDNVEIYENDILTDEGDFGNNWWDYGHIEFDEVDFTYAINWMNEEIVENITLAMNYSIAGNIFENPDLVNCFKLPKQREIKFKVHSKKDDKVSIVKSIDYINKVITTKNGTYNFDDSILLKFLNVYDKNGNEIFENDTLTNEKGKKGVIELDDDNLSYIINWDNGSKYENVKESNKYSI